MIGGGLLLAFGTATLGVMVNGVFFSPVDIGAGIGLPLPRGLYLSTAMLFEAAICLAVVSSTSLMLDTLSHPGGDEEQSGTHAQDGILEQKGERATMRDDKDLVAHGEGERM